MSTRKPKLSLATTSSAGTTVNVQAVGSTYLNLIYNTLSGNQPSSYGNTVFLWQNTPSIPYNQQPLKSQPVPGNTQGGSMTFSDLQIQEKPYIVGYAVGPDVSNICSWGWIPAGSGDSQTFQTSIYANPQDISPDSVVAHYQTPDGNNPQNAKQYVAIFQGSIAPYSGAPLKQVNITSTNSTDSVPIPVTLLRGTTYTLAYFMGPKQTMMAATFTFTTN